MEVIKLGASFSYLCEFEGNARRSLPEGLTD